jgi:hypothetical protein
MPRPKPHSRARLSTDSHTKAVFRALDQRYRSYDRQPLIERHFECVTHYIEENGYLVIAG